MRPDDRVLSRASRHPRRTYSGDLTNRATVATLCEAGRGCLLLGLFAAVTPRFAFIVWLTAVLATGQFDDLGADLGCELFQFGPAEPYLEQLQVEVLDSDNGKAGPACAPAGATPASDKDLAHMAPFWPDLPEPVRLTVNSLQVLGSTIL